MKKIIYKTLVALTVLLRTCQPAAAQINFDTLIITPAYDVYYSFKDKAPVLVIYKLYKGGGTCDRIGDVFKNTLGDKEASAKDYKYSGYDIGHMCNSKDEAYNCTLQEETFRFFNSVPQTPEMNRGVWKHFETSTRYLSQTDSLLVICYNHFSDKKLNGRVSIPDTCYKIVYSQTTRKIVLAVGVTNTEKPVQTEPTNFLVREIYLATKPK